MISIYAFLFFVVAKSALVATPRENTVDVSGLLPLNNSSTAVHQIFNGTLGAGWHWKEPVNVSVNVTNVGWVYMATRSGLVETFEEKALPTSSGSPFGTCNTVVCYCNTHADYVGNVVIYLSLVETYYTHSVAVQASAWSVDVSVTTPSATSTATLTSSQTSFTSDQLNVSVELNTSMDCFTDLSTHTMLALTTNLSDVIFLESSWLGDQHNKIGYSGSTWVSDFSCSMFGGELWILPESPDGTSAFYTNMGWDITSLRSNPLHLFKSGVYPSDLIEVILNSSNVAADNTASCQIETNETTNASAAQSFFVSGTNTGVLNLSIEVPIATFLQFITGSPSRSPTSIPSQHPSLSPSTDPSGAPTSDPSPSPSSSPSSDPTGWPTSTPSQNPSSSPSMDPTGWPSSSPSQNPSRAPSGNPSEFPSSHPTAEPTSPTFSPTAQPSSGPSMTPVTSTPSITPTNNPTALPSISPSTEPSRAPVPTASFSAEIFGILFVTGLSVESLLNSHVERIQSTIASQLSIDFSRVIVTRVVPTSRRRLGRNLQSQVLRVDFTLKGYLSTIETLKSQLELPLNANAIAVSLGNSISGATIFDVGTLSTTCPDGQTLSSNGVGVTCVSACGIDETFYGGLCKAVVAQTISIQSQTSTVNYLGRALYTVLGLFSWGFCVLIFNVCDKMRR